MISSSRAAAAAFLVIVATACQDASLPTTGDDPGPALTGGANTGWISTPRGEPMEVKYQIIDGDAIIEGDINLGPVGTIARTRQELLSRSVRPNGPRYGSVVDGLSNSRWAYGEVPYVISSQFNATQRQVVLNAMQHIASTTAGTKFTPRTSQGAYVSFALHSSACNSNVGRQGGGQTINLTSGCAYSMGSVAHEVLHALGMWHEQSRCDRDNYVTIHLDNVISDQKHNFDKRCPASGWFWDIGGIDVLSYDEGSLMHYPTHAFSRNNLATISSKRGRDGDMGQNSGLVQTDASTINYLYQPYPVQGISITYPGGTPTLSWNAYNKGATGYAVNLVVVYEEYDDYNGTSVINDSWVDGVGFTTGLSIQDLQHSYTGDHRCIIYSSIYGTTSYAYYYEIAAGFPDGIGGQPVRWPAMVAPQTC